MEGGTLWQGETQAQQAVAVSLQLDQHGAAAYCLKVWDYKLAAQLLQGSAPECWIVQL